MIYSGDYSFKYYSAPVIGSESSKVSYWKEVFNELWGVICEGWTCLMPRHLSMIEISQDSEGFFRRAASGELGLIGIMRDGKAAGVCLWHYSGTLLNSARFGFIDILDVEKHIPVRVREEVLSSCLSYARSEIIRRNPSLSGVMYAETVSKSPWCINITELKEL